MAYDPTFLGPRTGPQLAATGVIDTNVPGQRPKGLLQPGLAPDLPWVQYQHPEYAACRPMWEFARDHYTGMLLDQKRLPLYLPQRRRGESPEQWAERLSIADYTPHFSAVVDSLAGMLYASEADATRVWKKEDQEEGPWGDPEKADTPIGALWRDADGMGNGWQTLWKMFAAELIGFHWGYVLCDSIDGAPYVRLIEPERVHNWMDDGSAMMVCESVDTRASIEDEPIRQERYILYGLTGWKRFYIDKNNKVQQVAGAEGEGAYAYVDRRGKPTLPIYRIKLPTKRMVGYLLARKAGAMFNMESARDFLLRVANFPKLNLIAKDQFYKKLAQGLAEGDNVLQNDPANGASTHHYVAPDPSPATVATEVLKDKVTAFYATAFREYGDMAREKTATEVRQDISSGVGAFLQLLKTSVDDAENMALWLTAQTLWPQQRENWGIAKVERSDDFMPPDINAVVERMALRYFGDKAAVPLGRAGQIEVAKRVAEWDGLNTNPDEIAASVDTANILRIVDAAAVFEIPPEGKARLSVKLLETTGVIAAEEEVDGPNGEKIKLRDALLKQALDMEQQKQEAAAQQRDLKNSLLAEGNRPPPGSQ